MRTEIDGYLVELCIDDSSQCYISKNGFSASLEWLLQFEELDAMAWPGRDTTHTVSPATILKIQQWAEANGY